jgi:uncharacterized delta-60 repeat protein
VESLALQRDGKIVAAGRVDDPSAGFSAAFAIARFDSNGGQVKPHFTQAFVRHIRLLPEGRILAVGQDTQPGGSFVAAARYKSDGSLDTEFGASGMATAPFFAGRDADLEEVSIDEKGVLVAAGRAVGPANKTVHSFALARYNRDLSPDSAFGNGGEVVAVVGNGTDEDTVRALAFQCDGRILAPGDAGCGNDMALARYDSDRLRTRARARSQS